MKIFTSNPIVHDSLINSNIYSSCYIPNANITKNLGMVKVVISEIWGKFKDEDEVAKVELINLTKDKVEMQ